MKEYMNIYKTALQNNICKIKFEKKDGTIRDMRCTLREDYLPKQTDLEEQIQRKTPVDTLAVWDIDNCGWRSFRIDSVISIDIGDHDYDASGKLN